MKLKLLNIFSNSLKGIKNSIKRFPITMIYAGLLCVFGLIYINNGNYSTEYLPSMIEALGFGLIMSLAIGVFIETKKGKYMKKTILLYGVHGICVFLLYRFLQSETHYKIGETYVAIILLSILMAGFIGRLSNPKDYETYVAKILESAFIGFINCLLLLLGLFFILFTLSSLFSIYIHGEIYGYIYTIIFILMFTALFISRYPRHDDDFQNLKLAEVGEKLYSYILVPLILVYTLILYAFFIKILFTRTWPNGIVSHLVLWYSMVGVFVLFFTKSVVQDNKILKFFRKYYPRLNLVNVVLMFYALYVRISSYGFTVNRYLVLMGAIWVLLMDLYYILKEDEKNIIVPISISAFIVISILSPINAFKTSIRSQNKRMEDLFLRTGVLQDGNLIEEGLKNLSDEDKMSLASSFNYLNYNFGIESIKLPNDSDASKRTAIKDMNFSEYNSDYNSISYVYYINESNFYTVEDYKYMVKLNSWNTEEINLGELGIKLDLDYLLTIRETEEHSINLETSLNEKFDLINISNDKQIEFEETINGREIKIIISRLNGQYKMEDTNKYVSLSSLEGLILIK